MNSIGIELVSADSRGNPGNADSYAASISADGRYVAFDSNATNLVSGDTNGTFDIFVRDRQTKTTTMISIDSSSNQMDSDSSFPSISADGCCIVFQSDASPINMPADSAAGNIFIHILPTGTTDMVTIGPQGNPGNMGSVFPSLSANGRYVVFASRATNLVAGVGIIAQSQILIRDLQTDTTALVSADSSGNQGNSGSAHQSVSADGRYVAFMSNATNLVPGDTNGTFDIFIRDRQTNTTTLISVDSSGNPGDNESQAPSISANGRYVAFASRATNFVSGSANGNWEIYVRDWQTNSTILLSVDSNNNPGDGNSMSPSISADGRYVAFSSYATNLVSGITKGAWRIYVRDRLAGVTSVVSLEPTANQNSVDNYFPSISADGHYVAFESCITDKGNNNNSCRSHIFVATLPR